jgi:hypothetical protein
MALRFNQKSGWQDWANVVLAILLFISPWMFQFAVAPATADAGGAVGNSAAAWNAWVSALVVAGLAVAALLRFFEWEEWLNGLVGLWIMVSPWVLGFSATAAAMWSAVVLGALIAIASFWKAIEAHQGGSQATA